MTETRASGEASGTDSGIGSAPGPSPQNVLRGSSVPARWRITGWIVLTTLVALVAVTITARNTFLTNVDRSSNTEVEQEVEEFATFAMIGEDPTTAQPFTSARRMLELYLSRQIANDGEVILGVFDGDVIEGTDGSSSGIRGFDLAGERQVLEEMTGEAVSGTLMADGAGEIRWGRADFVLGDESGSLVIAQFTRARDAAVDSAILTLIWVALGGLLLSSGIAWLVAGQILAPIRAVRSVARDITERDLTARVPVSGRDDIAAVADTFNDMLNRLEHAYTTQRRFVDDASHELRTPITVIRGHLELLDAGDPAARAETLRLVDGELGRMARIVSDLLMLARAEQPDFVRPAPVDCTDLMLDIEAKAQALGDRRWLLMEVAEGTVSVDTQRLTQAVLQLAVNAVQYTGRGDDIRLGSRFEGEGDQRRLRFWVEDDGPGVQADEASRIFERFRHGSADAVPSDRTYGGDRGGAGLGLSIVRAIADGHHGSAWLSSTPGSGATFGIDVPVPEPRTGPREADTLAERVHA